MRIYKSVLLVFGACLALSACQTTPAGGNLSSGPGAVSGKGVSKRSLADAERLYKQKPGDEALAADYARALREDGRAEQASVVLGPFATAKTPAVASLTEYSSIQLALADYKKAERFAQKAVSGDPKNYRAYHNLGLALEAQGKHPEAEKAFRKGLELWQGDDPTPAMNNLALNLASQGYLDESIDLLRRAQAIAPDRPEIERNVRIVTALQQAARGPAPTPPRKPAS